MPTRRGWRGQALGAALVWLGAALPAAAVGLDLGRGLRLVVGGQVQASYGSDDPGSFNANRSGYVPQRLFRLGLTAELRAGSRIALLSELRSDNLETFEAAALYLRLRLVAQPALDLQAGRIPPLVGGFTRRYGAGEGPLIGTPLPFQYPTSLRPDLLPPGPDVLLRVRGYGALAGGGGPYDSVGLPLVEGRDWDTGAQARLAAGPVELAAAYTRGSACDPVVEDDNAGHAWSARAQWRPAFGLVLAVSGERGAYLADGAAYGAWVKALLQEQHQTVLALDAEYAAGHALLRFELLRSAWEAPTVRPGEPLVAWSAVLEGRYKLAPGLEAGLRGEHVAFDQLAGRRLADTWDAPVWRIEAGLARRLRRNVGLAASYQYNWRDGGPRREGGLVSARAQVSF